MGANRERAIAALREMWGMPQTKGAGVLQPHEWHIAAIEKAIDEAEQRGRESAATQEFVDQMRQGIAEAVAMATDGGSLRVPLDAKTRDAICDAIETAIDAKKPTP